MKNLIIILIMLPISLFCIAPRTTIVSNCSDGSKATYTEIDTDQDGKFDSYMARNCQGTVKAGRIRMSVTSPPMPPEHKIGNFQEYNCSASGVTTDFTFDVLDSNNIKTHEGVKYCGNDTVFISEYIIPPPILKSDNEFDNTAIEFSKDKIFKNLNSFFQYIDDNNLTKESIEYRIVLFDNIGYNTNVTRFNATKSNFKDNFERIINGQINKNMTVLILSKENNYMIKP